MMMDDLDYMDDEEIEEELLANRSMPDDEFAPLNKSKESSERACVFVGECLRVRFCLRLSYWPTGPCPMTVSQCRMTKEECDGACATERVSTCVWVCAMELRPSILLSLITILS